MHVELWKDRRGEVQFLRFCDLTTSWVCDLTTSWEK
jgi:hypothetical protein